MIVTPAEQFTSQYSRSDMTTELLNEDHLTAKPTAPPLDAESLPIATIVVEDQNAMVPPSTPPTKEDEDNATTSSTAAVASTQESKRECITKYPEAYQIRCACCEIGRYSLVLIIYIHLLIISSYRRRDVRLRIQSVGVFQLFSEFRFLMFEFRDGR